MHELDHRRDFFLGLDELIQPFEPRLGDQHHADVGLDGAEG